MGDTKKSLEEQGIPVGSWSRTTGGTRPLPSTLIRQKEMLEKLRGILEVQVEQDRVRLAELLETVNRIKHGGGR